MGLTVGSNEGPINGDSNKIVEGVDDGTTVGNVDGF